MKKINIYIIIFLFSLIYYGCDKPAPIQLFPDEVSSEDQIEIEIIAKDPSNEAYGNGFDSTGVTDNLIGFTNVIITSGIKVSYRNLTFNTSLAQAFFFDKSKPVYSCEGDLIGFETKVPGILGFNDRIARKFQYRVKYRCEGIVKDTLLGFGYILHRRRGLFNGDDFEFPYNSFINFSLDPLIAPVINFNIPTPSEISANANIEGRIQNKTLRAVLEWNNSQNTKLELILGGQVRGKETVIPLFKLKIKDDGHLIIPPKLLNEIPFARFDKIVFTFVRKYEKHHTEGDNDLFVLSQSIHSLVIDIP